MNQPALRHWLESYGLTSMMRGHPEAGEHRWQPTSAQLGQVEPDLDALDLATTAGRIAVLRAAAREHGRGGPLPKDKWNRLGLSPHSGTYLNQFGTWDDAWRAAGFQPDEPPTNSTCSPRSNRPSGSTGPG